MPLVKWLFKIQYMSNIMSVLWLTVGASPHKVKQTLMQSTAFCGNFEMVQSYQWIVEMLNFGMWCPSRGHKGDHPKMTACVM